MGEQEIRHRPIFQFLPIHLFPQKITGGLQLACKRHKKTNNPIYKSFKVVPDTDKGVEK